MKGHDYCGYCLILRADQPAPLEMTFTQYKLILQGKTGGKPMTHLLLSDVSELDQISMAGGKTQGVLVKQSCLAQHGNRQSVQTDLRDRSPWRLD